jgi:hypothetical protein
MVGRTVEATRQIGGDDLDVLRGRLDEIDDRDLADVSEVLYQGSVPHTSGIKCRVVPIFRCIVTCACTQYMPGRTVCSMPYTGASQIIDSEDRAYDVPPHLVEYQHLPYCAVGGCGDFMGVVLCVDVGDWGI